MTKFDSKRKLDVDWDKIVKQEEDNKALINMSFDCISERMKATNNRFAVNDNMIYEFCYHSRKLAMEAFKNAFKDFVIWKLKDYTDEQQESERLRRKVNKFSWNGLELYYLTMIYIRIENIVLNAGSNPCLC